jgi:MFS family permease
VELPRTLRSLNRPALRLFFAGHSISLLGSWMAPVAQQWLVWRLTHSTQMLGLLTFCSQLPSLLLGAWAGSVAERLPRKTVVVVALAVAALQASTLAVLALTGAVRPGHVLLLGVMLGLTYPFEIPARQMMLAELAGEDLPNVVAVNSTLVTVMRILGPSLGGLIVAEWGEGWCFAINAVSFVAVIAAVIALPVPKHVPHGEGVRVPISEAVKWAWHEPHVRALFFLLFALSAVGQAWGTLMPAWVSNVLHGGPDVLGHLLSFGGAGALLAAMMLLFADTGIRWRVGAGGLVMAAGIVGLSLSQSSTAAAFSLFFIGLGQVTQSSGILTELQQRSPSHLRGRLLGLFTMAFVGMVPVGGLVAGLVASELGSPFTLRCIGALLASSAALYLAQLIKTSARARSPST